MSGITIPFPELGDSTPVDWAKVLHPWERLPTETEGAFLLFVAYVDQAYPKGYGGDPVARNKAELERTLKVAKNALAVAARLNHWDIRAGAWDREVDRRKRSASLGQVDLVRKNQIRIATKARNLGEIELDKFLSLSSKSAAPVLTAKEALAILDWGAKLERGLTEGASTPQDLATANGPVDLASLELEDLEKMHALLKKAGKRK